MSTWTRRSPFGPVRVTTTHAGVAALDWVRGARPSGVGEAAVDDALDAYFDGELDALLDVEVDLSGVPAFRRAVLEALRKVRGGELTSYGALAAAAGRRGAARACGQAVGGNPVPLIVPCHRVVASDGSLGGFGLGLDLKRALLAHEGVDDLRGGWATRRAEERGWPSGKLTTARRSVAPA